MKEEKSKDLLRGERLAPMPNEVLAYTSSIKFDIPIAKHVVDINKAHVLMLLKKKIIPECDAAAILKVLNELSFESIDAEGCEDIHVLLEKRVIEALGEESGGKIHVAKSRNDQVATALRMELRLLILKIVEALIKLRKTLIDIAKKHSRTVMPGYTHLQQAQPVTLGHYLIAHHDAFERDTERLKSSFLRINRSPMGSGALATTTFEIDREFTAELLGFEGLIENSIDAVSDRDFAVETLGNLSLISVHLSRLAEELILWSTSELSIVRISDEYVSTSSIMPQKRNPEVAELIRARSAHIIGGLIASLTILKGLPLSYNSDLQEITPHLWDSCETTLSSMNMMIGMLESLKFDEELLYKRVSESFSLATDIADMLVSQYGFPFRTAHRIVGDLVFRMISEGKKPSEITADLIKKEIEKTTGKIIDIEASLLKKILSPEFNVERRGVIGGPSPNEVLRMCKDRDCKILRDEEWVKGKLTHLAQAEKRLKTLINEVVRRC